MSLPRFTRWLGFAGVLLFIFTVSTQLPNRLAAWLETPSRIEPADAIVVLGGGGVWSDGELSNISLRRALQGVRLYRRGLAPVVVFSGAPSRTHPTEAAARASLARELGLPPEAILTEGGSFTTRDEICVSIVAGATIALSELIWARRLDTVHPVMLRRQHAVCHRARVSPLDVMFISATHNGGILIMSRSASLIVGRHQVGKGNQGCRPGTVRQHRFNVIAHSRPSNRTGAKHDTAQHHSGRRWRCVN